MRGGLFGSFVISEFIKNRYNKDKPANLNFWRDSQGHEIDCLIEKGEKLTPIEIKSGKTINSEFFDGLKFWNDLSGNDSENSFLIYGGYEKQVRSGIKVIDWKSLSFVFPKS